MQRNYLFCLDFVYFELVTKIKLHSSISLCNKIITNLSVWNSCIPHNILYMLSIVG